MKQLRRKVPELLENVDLHLDEMFSKVLVPGLKATKTVFFTHAGVVTDSRKYIDYEQRGQYFDPFWRLLGLLGVE
jgi:hypothetical protein